MDAIRDFLIRHWESLSQGARDNIVGSVIGGLVLAIATGVWYFFGARIKARFRRTLPEANEPGQTNQHTTHEVVVKVEQQQASAPPLITPEPEPPPSILSNIPRPPVVEFVARRDADGRDIVARLREELAPEKNQLMVLRGAGGLGKTTLAAQAARTLSEAFERRIIWVSADGRHDFTFTTFLDDIATQFKRTDLRKFMLEPKKEQVRDLIAVAPALVVLDNFETISEVEREQCAEWLANGACCPALITSREPVKHARPINIHAMSLEEAQEFLEKLIGQADKPRSFVELDRRRIIDAAGSNPLVMQWLVGQIGEARQPGAVLSELLQGKGDAAQRVFDRSFDLPQLGDDGRAVLLALALFAPDASRPALAVVAGFGDDASRLDDAVRHLSALSLVEPTDKNERLGIEGLTRELTQARLSRDGLAAAFSDRFTTYFTGYAQSHAQPTAEDFNELESERGNILAAMDAAFATGDWTNVTRLQICNGGVSRPPRLLERSATTRRAGDGGGA